MHPEEFVVFDEEFDVEFDVEFEEELDDEFEVEFDEEFEFGGGGGVVPLQAFLLVG